MEVFGGFMMMLSIICFFLTVIWFILPFVIFNIKGRVDRTLFLVEEMDKRLAALESRLNAPEPSVRGERAEEAELPPAPRDAASQPPEPQALPDE
jgi:hypothetical protein